MSLRRKDSDWKRRSLTGSFSLHRGAALDLSVVSEIYTAYMRAHYGLFPELLPGTLQMLILRVLEGGPLHGYAIARRIEQTSRESLTIQWGSLYPTLNKTHRKGWLNAEWGLSEHNRKARLYRLTPEGRRRLEHEAKTFQKLVKGIRLVMRPA